MDSNTPPSFMSLLDGNDSPQSGPNNATPTPSTHHRSLYYPPPLSELYSMHTTAYPPPSFHHFRYHPYYQPPPYPMNFSGGSSQNPPNLPPPYYPSPNNEIHNVPPIEYPYYPYYPPPPTNSNYLSAGSNSTPLSKRSHSEAEDDDNETVAPTETPHEGAERPEGRKAAKRRLREKGNNNIIDVVTKQMNAMSSGSDELKNAFLKFIGQISKAKSHKKMIREEMLKLEPEKLKLEEDRIMMMDTSSMTPDQVAYIQLRRAEILKKRLGKLSEP